MSLARGGRGRQLATNKGAAPVKRKGVSRWRKGVCQRGRTERAVPPRRNRPRLSRASQETRARERLDKAAQETARQLMAAGIARNPWTIKELLTAC
jgi:hypothetical protein